MFPVVGEEGEVWLVEAPALSGEFHPLDRNLPLRLYKERRLIYILLATICRREH